MVPNRLFPQLDINMERKLYFPCFQGDLMLGFVVVGKDLFPVLYLKVKLGFACDTKETVTQFDLWQIVVIAYLSLLASVWNYFYYAKLMFLVFCFVLVLLSSGAVWRMSQQVLLFHWQFHLEPACLIWFASIFCEERQ